MNGLVQGTGPCTLEANWESESGAGSESGFGSPASLGEWDLGVKSLTGSGKDPQTRPCGFGPPGSYIWNHIRCIC